MDDPEGGFMEYIEEIQEQVILVGVQLDENDNVKESLDELEELADTAGAQTVGKIIQNRETVKSCECMISVHREARYCERSEQ